VTLAARVAAAFAALAPPGTALVAVSGGPDSLALLDILHREVAAHGRALAVGHVDHGISTDSAAVAARVAHEAATRSLPFFARRLELGAGASETAARKARRTALKELAGDAGASSIVLGHHADDQAETVLLRMLRGSGPAGLAGMATQRGLWVRPLLGERRAALSAWLAERGITPWTDPANSDPRHLRSWLRTAVIPVLAARLPDLTEKLLSAAGQAAEARRAWNAIPGLLPALEFQAANATISVAAAPLSGYRSEVRHAVLAGLARHFGVALGARRLQMIDRLFEIDGKAPRVRVAGNLEVELTRGRLVFYRPVSVMLEPVALGLGDTLFGEARFAVRSGFAGTASRGGWTTWLEPAEYAVRPWQAGDRIRPLGGSGARPVGVLFRETGIAPHARAGWPVVVAKVDATIIWVPGICRAEARRPGDGTEAWHVECAIAGNEAPSGRP
jgi:tRNA(Ile)-lysidine synthase